MFMSCGNDKIYDKQLKNNEINVDWYHYSYITSNSPNYVEVRKGAEKELIFEDIEFLEVEIYEAIICFSLFMSGTHNSAAAEGVGARRSATKSQIVKSVS